MIRARIAALALLACTLVARRAPAQDRFSFGPAPNLSPRPRAVTGPAAPWVYEGFYYRSMLVARVNPLGLFEDLRFGYRARIFNSVRDTFTMGSYVGLSATAVLTPAWERVGALLEFQPLSMLNLSVQYEFVGHLGTFNTVTSYRSPAAEHSDTVQRNLGTMGLNYGTTGHLVTLSGLVQARLGSVVLRSQFRGVYSDLALRAGDTVYYDIFLDVMAPNRGWLLANDTDLVWQQAFDVPGLNLGVRYSQVDAFYTAASYAPGEPGPQTGTPTVNTPTRRIGPLFTYTFFERRRGGFNAPTIFAIVNWYLDHRYRTGVDVSQAVPYAVLGFTFRGEIL